MAVLSPETEEKKGIAGIGVAELKAMPPEELFEHLEPLIYKWSNSFIPGFDREDRRQEILVVIWKCQMKYDPEGKRGYNDRPSSFLNFVIHAIKMRLGNCKYTGERQQYATNQLECWECSHTVPVFSQSKKCPQCGGSRWKTLRNVKIASVDKLSEYSDAWQPAEEDEYTFGFDAEEVIDFIVSKFPAGRQEAVRSALLRGKLTPKTRERVLEIVHSEERIWAALRDNPGILHAGASSPITGQEAQEDTEQWVDTDADFSS